MARMSSICLFSVFYWFWGCSLGMAFGAKFGVVVERVGKLSVLEEAGIKPGDLLLSWAHSPNPNSTGRELVEPVDSVASEGVKGEDPAGRFDTVFTWLAFLDEDAPRGTIKLYGERDGEERMFEVPPGDWLGTEVRPVMPRETLTHYLKGKALVDSGKVPEGVAEWEKILKDNASSSRGSSYLSCWLRAQMGKAWIGKGNWEKADAALNAALKLADGPWSRIAVWVAIGEARQAQLQLAQAGEAYSKAAEIWKTNAGEGLGFAQAIGEVGNLAERQSKLPLAEKLLDRALEIQERLAPDSLIVAATLTNLGNVAYHRSDFDTASDYYQCVLALRESLAPGSAGVARSLYNLGHAAQQCGDLNAAHEYFQRALTIEERLAPGSMGEAAMLNSLGSLAFARRDWDTATYYYQRTLGIRETLAPSSIEVARILTNLGGVAYYRGELDTAEVYYQWAVTIQERLAPNSFDMAHSFNLLGSLASDRGDLSAADAYHQRALAIQENLAPDSLGLAASLNYLGIVARTRGDLNTAHAYHERALAITERMAPGSRTMAICLSNLGIVAENQYDVGAAKAYFQRAMTILESLGDTANVAISLGQLGNLAYVSGDLDAATAYFERVLAIMESWVPDSLEVGAAYNNLGNVAWKRGALDTAEAHYQRALVIFKKMGAESFLASALLNLGDVAYGRGEWHAARAYYQRALAKIERLGSGNTGEAWTLSGLAKTFRRMGQADQATTHFQRSIEALESQLANLGGSDHVKAGFLDQYEDLYRDYIDFLLSRNQAETAFAILERARARVLHQMISKRDLVLLGEGIPETLERNRKRVAYRYEKAQQALMALDPAKDEARIEALRTRLQELRRDHDQAIEEIQAASPRFANLRFPKPLNLAGVRQMLDPGTVMLSYCVTQEKTFLFVVRKQAELGVHTIEAGEPYFRDRVHELHGVIRDPTSTVAGSYLQELSTELFNKLIAPAKKDIEAGNRLLIIPDGPLHKLPFNLLMENEGQGTRYLIEWKPMATIVSATIYTELKQRKTRSPPRIAAFGDPIYPKLPKLAARPVQIPSRGAVSVPARQPTDPALRGFLRDNPNELQRLPYTAAEIHAIAQAYPGQTRLYLEEEASEQNVKSLGKEPSIIHLACHGWANDRFPLESALALTIRDGFGEGDENGILQAWEIFAGMRIDADLLVLSACETGLGKVTGAEGLIGLTRAFQFAGARSIIASYWNVEDQSTLILMKRFYAYLREGIPKSEALRQAQLDLIRRPVRMERPYFFGRLKKTVKRDVSHPYYWAAFQLIGPWD